jgi:hypothetical protein
MQALFHMFVKQKDIVPWWYWFCGDLLMENMTLPDWNIVMVYDYEYWISSI